MHNAFGSFLSCLSSVDEYLFPYQEFFLLLIEEIFDDKYGMFKTIEGSPNVWFNSQVCFHSSLVKIFCKSGIIPCNFCEKSQVII